MSTVMTLAELRNAEDVDLGASSWVEITQERVDQFADATDDHQWIHVDPERAKDSPFGGTIAHGYLTLSLMPRFIHELLEISDRGMGINYGIDKLRLTAPVPVGSRVRAHMRLAGSEDKAGGVLHRLEVQVEVEGQDKPALVGTVLIIAMP